MERPHWVRADPLPPTAGNATGPRRGRDGRDGCATEMRDGCATGARPPQPTPTTHDTLTTGREEADSVTLLEGRNGNTEAHVNLLRLTHGTCHQILSYLSPYLEQRSSRASSASRQAASCTRRHFPGGCHWSLNRLPNLCADEHQSIADRDVRASALGA